MSAGRIRRAMLASCYTASKKSPDENRAWHISGQDVLLLAELIKTGKYPLERTVVLAGSMAQERLHVQTRLGAPLMHVAGELRENPIKSRYIVGGIFSGYTAEKDSYLGLYQTSLVILPEGDQREMFAFARPGFNKPSHSKVFLSSAEKNAIFSGLRYAWRGTGLRQLRLL